MEFGDIISNCSLLYRILPFHSHIRSKVCMSIHALRLRLRQAPFDGLNTATQGSMAGIPVLNQARKSAQNRLTASISWRSRARMSSNLRWSVVKSERSKLQPRFPAWPPAHWHSPVAVVGWPQHGMWPNSKAPWLLPHSLAASRLAVLWIPPSCLQALCARQ